MKLSISTYKRRTYIEYTKLNIHTHRHLLFGTSAHRAFAFNGNQVTEPLRSNIVGCRKLEPSRCRIWTYLSVEATNDMIEQSWPQCATKICDEVFNWKARYDLHKLMSNRVLQCLWLSVAWTFHHRRTPWLWWPWCRWGISTWRVIAEA